MYKKLFGSIRFKSFIIFVVVSIVPLIVLSNMLISSFRSDYENEMKTSMFRKANTIATNLVVTGYFNENRNKEYLSTINALVDGRTLIIDATGMVIFDSNDIETGKLYVTKGILTGLNGEGKYSYLKKENLGKVVTPIMDTQTKTVLGVVVVTSSYENLTTSISSLKNIALLIVLGFVILIIILSYVTSGLLTKPFKLFIKYIKGVTEGHIDEKLTVRGNNEIEEISISFNHMIHRFLEVEENRQQFVANVSHELKTPLSSMKVLAESILSREDVSKEIYREFLEDINSEVDRESKIINDLLTLVTLDKKDNQLNVSKVNVNELVEATLKRLKPIAGKRNIQMIFESYRSIVAEIDETKMALAITNLVENAIKYNKDFGLITTSLNADHKEFELVVKDTGIGIPEDSIEKIFERFYRIDKNRARDTGGTGLGLSIVSKTVLMHYGTIRCESEVEKGTKFIVKIPLKHII
ncbi:MAG: hypothetical protein CVU84_00455 [Firmicutes bacterium HGW-Firmicutes-1]|jgi:signal transduction histidine kinase|nr:MAG: hypothetical protein CVU84_00455 [Firmicutes bacterium HGW-Firmicutes-1]